MPDAGQAIRTAVEAPQSPAPGPELGGAATETRAMGWRDRLRALTRRRGPLVATIITIVTLVWVFTGELPHDPQPASLPAPTTAEAQTAAASPAPAAPFAVRVVTVRQEPHAVAVRLSGRTEAARRVVLKAETQGQVATVAAGKGAVLAAGAEILRFAEADRAALLDEARSLVRSRALEYEAAAKLQARGFQSENRAAASAAALAEARGKLASAQAEFARTRIAAPFAGVLLDRVVEIGDVVQPGDPLATVLDLDPLIVVAQAGERQVSAIRPGDPAAIRFLDGRRREGQIRFVAAGGDPATRTFRVEVAVPNPADAPGGRLQEGLSADVLLALAPRPAHKLPRSVLSLDDEGRIGVKLVAAGDMVRFVPVTPIADDGDGLWLTGLPEVATVIVLGQDMVAAGQQVRPEAVTP